MSDPAPTARVHENAAKLPASSEQATRTARAARIEAMLDRWSEEDCSDEPEWDVAEITPLRLGAVQVESERRGGAP